MRRRTKTFIGFWTAVVVFSLSSPASRHAGAFFQGAPQYEINLSNLANHLEAHDVGVVEALDVLRDLEQGSGAWVGGKYYYFFSSRTVSKEELEKELKDDVSHSIRGLQVIWDNTDPEVFIMLPKQLRWELIVARNELQRVTANPDGPFPPQTPQAIFLAAAVNYARHQLGLPPTTKARRRAC